MATNSMTRLAMPSLDPGQVESLLFHSADVILTISDDDIVIDAMASVKLDPLTLFSWIGFALPLIVTDDSKPKIPVLLSENMADAGPNARWRHVNFLLDGGESLPLLVKYMCFDSEDRQVRLLIGRDLRPVAEIQQRFQMAQLEMENTRDAANFPLRPAKRAERVEEDILADLGKKPLDTIVSETARMLERVCILEALRRCAGDQVEAAALLGLNADDLQARLRSYR
ncbi:MAG: helix-turn-helix domain-containing protein [Pseudomonadota bacterium]